MLLLLQDFSTTEPEMTTRNTPANLAALVAAYAAKGGTVTHVATGARRFDEEVMHDLAHGTDNQRLLARASAEPATHARRTVFDHMGREHGRNALGEWLY